MGESEYFPILDTPRTVNMKSGFVTLEPGRCVGEHSTGAYEETLIILEGMGEIEAEGMARQRIARGQVVYVPPETKHNVSNSGNDLLRYISVVARAR
jgi:quercetin dioxygenase-like cupin family protein